jgi:hypothetical protein
MSSTEIDITSLISSSHFVPHCLSNNRATLGDNAARITWNASKSAAVAIQPPLLDTEEKKQEFRDFVESSGGWDKEEISAWNDIELNALFLQWVAGDIRECFGDADFNDWDWQEYEKEASAGHLPSRIFKGSDNRIYFYIGN